MIGITKLYGIAQLTQENKTKVVHRSNWDCVNNVSYTRKFKWEIWSLSDHCINTIAVATILFVMYGGESIVPPDYFSTNDKNLGCHICLQRNNINVCVIKVHVKKASQATRNCLPKLQKKKNVTTTPLHV